MLRGEEVKSEESGMTARPTCLSGKLTHALNVDMDMAANFFQHPVRGIFLACIRRKNGARSSVSHYFDILFISLVRFAHPVFSLAAIILQHLHLIFFDEPDRLTGRIKCKKERGR